jgi:tetratricopeptide (TPR) repeat protein
VTLWQMGEFERAATELRAALHIKPDYAEAYYTLGTVLKQMNKLPDAAEALRQAIELQPDFAGAHTTLSSVLKQMGDSAGAAKETEIAAQIRQTKVGLQTATFSTNSGMRLLQAGDLPGAISQFETAIQAAPDYAPAHQQLAIALRRQGDLKRAAQEEKIASNLSAVPTSQH